ncbi:MAG: DUF134 domain-containing protein [Candidatus Woesearchaeota archaeon]|nr:DUF134 domain-containing protein [Candidatus Woesearchaeota archaeon]
MVRPKRFRVVSGLPKFNYYKPSGVMLNELEEIIITVEGFEALKLKDYHNKSEIEASELMVVSQPTFNRLYVDTKQKLIKALVEGLAIRIEGGNYKMPNRDRTGPQGKGPKTGRGLGRCNKTNEDNSSQEENAKSNNDFVRGQGRGQGRNRD